MLKRFKTIGAATAALAALALGGSAIASATQSTASATKHHAATKAEKTTGPDTDAVQSGDQTSPDPKGAKSSSASAAEPVFSETAPETSSETSSESSTPSDGPGGHEDPAGDVENQSEAEE